MRYCFCCDLKEDEQLIAEYEVAHKKIWPEIEASIKSAGIESMEIYRVHTRLFMIMETNEAYSAEAKAKADAENPVVVQWETLMWSYQQKLPFAKPGEKWVPLKKIFELATNDPHK